MAMRNALLLLVLALFLPARALADPHIAWSVENRFRLFKSDAPTLAAEQALLTAIAPASIEEAYGAFVEILRADGNSIPVQLYKKYALRAAVWTICQ